jgi:hypothetical protein
MTDGNKNQYDAYASIIQPIPPPRKGASLVVKLENIIGTDATKKIEQAGKIVFHSVGDTGADKQDRIVDEDNVAAMMTKDLNTNSDANRPQFFYHLGDVVYEFGQPECYYSQFYEPYCTYNAPILAIPGNHDGMIWDKSMTSLKAFLNNFCASKPAPSPNAGGLLRTTMDQPGVYFTFEAPFVSIIGLYSNIVDKGPGIISSENGTYKVVNDVQKKFLISELKRLALAKKSGSNTAVILALHHPPYLGVKSEGNNLLKDIDEAVKEGGLMPDLVLSGHAHLYERFERNVNGRKVPYIVAGCGGYNLSPFEQASDPTVKVPPALASGDPALKAYVKSFGYLKVKATKDKLAVIFNCIDTKYGNAFDSILIDLNNHSVTEGKKGVEPL